MAYGTYESFNMRKIIFLFILTATIGFVFLSSAHAWLFYSKPDFRGRIIDAETKMPIEGAVVVVLYYKRFLVGNPGGPNSYVFSAKETLTDENGEFYISSYFSIILFSEDVGAWFIIFKPGYKSIEGRSLNAVFPGVTIGLEDYFDTDVIGKEAEIKYNNYSGETKTWKGPLGVVELKSVSPDRAMPPSGIPADYGAKELPLLYKAINEDRRNRGIGGEVK